MKFFIKGEEFLTIKRELPKAGVLGCEVSRTGFSHLVLRHRVHGNVVHINAAGEGLTGTATLSL